MREEVRDDSDHVGEFDHDEALAQALGLLDPAQQDPNYWSRFRSWVLSNTAAELARRRLMHELTVADVMSSWARGVVSTAALAAGLAALLLIRGPDAPAPQPVDVEELIVSEVEGETMPSLVPPETNGAVAFASEIF
jgi:Zn-dependent protease